MLRAIRMERVDPRDPTATVPVHEHLIDWDRPTAAAAGEAVEQMLRSEGWQRLQESIEARLRFEQSTLMRNQRIRPDEFYERTVGIWTGLRLIKGLAEGIVVKGRQADEELTEPAAEVA